MMHCCEQVDLIDVFHIGLPNVQDRKNILELYLKNVSYEFDEMALSVSLAGFSSAAIATLVNEAKLNMIKRDDKVILLQDIEMAKEKLEFGKKDNKILNESQREILAIYQASKAFITQSKTTLFQEGLKKEEIKYPSKSELLSQIKAYLSGFVGVEVLKQELYAVNSDDLKMANTIAKQLVHEYEMANDEQEVLNSIKDELKREFTDNKEKLLQLTQIMLNNEVILDNEL